MTTVRVKSEPSVKRKMKPRGKPFAGRNDPRVNLNGAPKRGESWREIIDSVGKMFAEEISAEVGNNDLGRAYRQLPRGIAMKRLVVMRVFAALMFEPTAGLWNPLMERVEGKVIQPISVSWLDKARAAATRQERTGDDPLSGLSTRTQSGIADHRGCLQPVLIREVFASSAPVGIVSNATQPGAYSGLRLGNAAGWWDACSGCRVRRDGHRRRLDYHRRSGEVA